MTIDSFYDIMVEAGIQPRQSREDWLKFFSEDSELWPIVKGGEMVGGVLFRSNTVHIAIKPEWQKKWVTPSMMRAYPHWKPLIDVIAPIQKGNEASARLAKRLGFELLEEQAEYLISVKRKHDEHPA